MSEQQAEKLLAVLVLARSSSYLMSKFVLGELDTFNLLALRFLIAFAVLAQVSLAVVNVIAGIDQESEEFEHDRQCDQSCDGDVYHGPGIPVCYRDNPGEVSEVDQIQHPEYP